jgi:hypothetical protein
MDWNQTKPIIGSKVDFSHPLSKGIVGCWLFNEGMGDKVYDLSGNQNTGTLTGFSHPGTVTSGWNPGKFGKGISFTTGTNLIRVPYSKNSNNKSFSIITNCNTTAIATYQVLFSQWETNELQVGFYASRLFIQIGGIYTDVGNVIPNTKSHNIAFTYNLVSASTFLDGNLGQTRNITNNISVTPDTVIGNLSNGSAPLLGNMQYLYLYNRGISSSEVQQLYISPFCFIN